MEDERIIQMYFERNERAVAETDQKYGAYCHSIAFHILGVREDAQECVNDTYFAVWRQIPPVIPASFRVFLGRITRNLSISCYRANHAKKRYNGMETLLSELDECIPSLENVEQRMEQKELSKLLSDWLDSLTEEECAVFVRRYWFGESIQSLAALGGFTTNQLTLRLMRLRKRLKAFLEKEGVAL